MPNDTEIINPMVGTKIKAVPKEQPEIGIDVDNQLLSNLLDEGISSTTDLTTLESFSTVAQGREHLYQMIDNMSQDPILASYLKTIATDAVETNDSGQIIWCESDDSNCGKYVSFLLDSMGVDKNAYKWMYSLAKYGDLYLRLYRQSDYEKNEYLFEDTGSKQVLTEAVKGDILNEDVDVIVYGKGDHYVNYVEMVPNPGEMFELTKFGKTAGYVKAPVTIYNNFSQSAQANQYFNAYKMNKKDVEVYSAVDFVHACIEDNMNRVPEKVELFTENSDGKEQTTNSYMVKRGQSELSNVFKIWRELSLLENSALLSRITKSSIIRTIQVEVGDMPKEKIGLHLNSIKQLMEQKTALNTGMGMAEYTNPGPVENNIYIPTHGGIGAITASNIGGDFDPKQLTDLSYFQDKLFGALGIPKAFFGITDDGAGFNGGESLAIQSSRYGKSIKRLQNTLIQAITDLINLLLIDRGLTSYINKFTIKMQVPVTREELDRRENKKNKIGVISDIMAQLTEISNPVVKLKILKSLFADASLDVSVIELLQEEIDLLEAEGKSEKDSVEGEPTGEQSIEPEGTDNYPEREEVPSFTNSILNEPIDNNYPSEENPVGEPSVDNVEEPVAPSSEEDSYLPSAAELGMDFTING